MKVEDYKFQRDTTIIDLLKILDNGPKSTLTLCTIQYLLLQEPLTDMPSLENLLASMESMMHFTMFTLRLPLSSL
jgi:hypothetical protein